MRHRFRCRATVGQLTGGGKRERERPPPSSNFLSPPGSGSCGVPSPTTNFMSNQSLAFIRSLYIGNCFGGNILVIAVPGNIFNFFQARCLVSWMDWLVGRMAEKLLVFQTEWKQRAMSTILWGALHSSSPPRFSYSPHHYNTRPPLHSASHPSTSIGQTRSNICTGLTSN